MFVLGGGEAGGRSVSISVLPSIVWTGTVTLLLTNNSKRSNQHTKLAWFHTAWPVYHCNGCFIPFWSFLVTCQLTADRRIQLTAGISFTNWPKISHHHHLSTDRRRLILHFIYGAQFQPSNRLQQECTTTVCADIVLCVCVCWLWKILQSQQKCFIGGMTNDAVPLRCAYRLLFYKNSRQ